MYEELKAKEMERKNVSELVLDMMEEKSSDQDTIQHLHKRR